MSVDKKQAYTFLAKADIRMRLNFDKQAQNYLFRQM